MDIIKVKKNYINYEKLSEPKSGVLFSDFINSVIERRQGRMSKNYGKSYKTLVFHLNTFSLQNNVELFTNSINEEFLDDFIVYLEERQLRSTYIKNLIDLVKSMVRRSAFQGYIVDTSYENVDLKSEDPFSIALSMNEVTRIYYYQGLTRKQERIRDLFVVGCLTALRYSDYSTLEKNNFRDGFIVKITKKTKKKVTIPIHPYVQEIYEKYDGNIATGLSIQHFNRYMKMICKKIGFDELIKFTYIVGGKAVEDCKPKWELISSHTARRSAATNLYLTGRFKAYEIMFLTGHTTERSFFRYIKISGEDIARQLSTDNYFRT